jgi:hypothetical protein
MAGPTHTPGPAERGPDEPGIPEPLARELRRMYNADPPSTLGLDAEVAAAARRRFAGRRAVAWRIACPLAAAAGLALAFWLIPWSGPPTGPGPAVAHHKDLNADGRVDILDAFLLARALDRDKPLLPEWDVNGDGVIDHRDADAIAAAAVRLDRESAS